MDWKATGFELHGTETSGMAFTALDPMIVPCASKITLYDGSVVGGEEDCEWDQQKVKNYMGSAFMMLSFYN